MSSDTDEIGDHPPESGVTFIRNHGKSDRALVPVLLLVMLFGAGAALARCKGAPCQRVEIHLRGAVFDPLDGPVDTPEELRLPPDTRTESWIVQFRAPLTREQRRLLTAEHGLKLALYIPDYAYLERIPAARLDRLRRLPFLRAALPYQPAFKISPRIGKLELRTPERKGMTGLLLTATLFDDADPGAVAVSLAAIPGVSDVVVHDFRDAGGSARLQFTLASGEGLPPVARLEAVRWIEEVAEQDEDLR